MTSEIYALCHPVTGEIRYIGKAVNSQKRLTGHIYAMKRRKTPLYSWMIKLNSEGLTPTIKILEIAPDWKEAEIRLIKHYRDNGARLLNVALGGDEPYCSKETRAANGRKNAAAIHSDPVRKRIWYRAINDSLKRGYVAEETKVKLRARAIQNPKLFGCWVNI